jgi:hypothetical protein
MFLLDGVIRLTNVRRRVRGRIIPVIGVAAVLPTVRSSAGIALRRFRPTASIRHGGASDCLVIATTHPSAASGRAL